MPQVSISDNVIDLVMTDHLHVVLNLYKLYTYHSLGGVDYTAGPYTVTFTAGQTSASFGITINDDNILERSETFTIEVDSSSLPTGVSVGGTSQATVAIDNDDCKLQICMRYF